MLHKFTIPSKSFVRHNSTISTLLSYAKDKSIIIPFADIILSKKEYDKYQIFRNIKLGNDEWLKQYVNVMNPKQEERVTITDYIKSLKEQSYSIPNCFIGYLSIKFGCYSILYSLPIISPMIFGGALTFDASHLLGGSLITGSALGLIALNISGLYAIKYGTKIISSELKSPYYDYDEMIRICQKQYVEK